MRSGLKWLLATPLAATPAIGQVGGEATWLWDVTTQNGDALVEPGETATITLSIDMEPNVNFPDGPVLGFGYAEFDTLGGLNTENGAILDWAFEFDHLVALLGDQTTTDDQSLFGTLVLQDPLGPFSADDPITILEFEWQPAIYDDYLVEYATATIDGEIFVFEGDADGWKDVPWPISEAGITFAVVPSPPALAMLSVLGCFAVPRRR